MNGAGIGAAFVAGVVGTLCLMFIGAPSVDSNPPSSSMLAELASTRTPIKSPEEGVHVIVEVHAECNYGDKYLFGRFAEPFGNPFLIPMVNVGGESFRGEAIKIVKIRDDYRKPGKNVPSIGLSEGSLCYPSRDIPRSIKVHRRVNSVAFAHDSLKARDIEALLGVDALGFASNDTGFDYQPQFLDAGPLINAPLFGSGARESVLETIQAEIGELAEEHWQKSDLFFRTREEVNERLTRLEQAIEDLANDAASKPNDRKKKKRRRRR